MQYLKNNWVKLVTIVVAAVVVAAGAATGEHWVAYIGVAVKVLIPFIPSDAHRKFRSAVTKGEDLGKAAVELLPKNQRDGVTP